MMKASIAVLAVAASFAAAAETNEVESAESSAFFVEASVDVLSDYIWRGKICNGNPVWQPSVTLGYDAGDFGKISANVWASMDLTHRRGTMNASRHACGIQELDYTLAYANSFGPVDIEIGHIWYSFPYGNGRSTEELYGTVAYNNPIVTPSFTAYWDYLDTEADRHAVGRPELRQPRLHRLGRRNRSNRLYARSRGVLRRHGVALARSANQLHMDALPHAAARGLHGRGRAPDRLGRRQRNAQVLNTLPAATVFTYLRRRRRPLLK